MNWIIGVAILILWFDMLGRWTDEDERKRKKWQFSRPNSICCTQIRCGEIGPAAVQ